MDQDQGEGRSRYRNERSMDQSYSKSPERDHSRKRNRSPPGDGAYVPNYNRDGYQPAPRYGNRGNRYQNGGGYHQSGPMMYGMMPPQIMMGGGGQRRMNDPTQGDTLCPFKVFADWQKSQTYGQIADEEISNKYQKYKEEFFSKSINEAFKTFKDDEWFKEKYHPDESAKLNGIVYERRCAFFESFKESLFKGDFDSVSYDDPQTEQEEPAKKEIDEEVTTDEYEKQLEKALETPADRPEQQGKESPYSNLVIVDKRKMPSIVIKTLPLSVTRAKLTEFLAKYEGIRHIYFSDPNPIKRNYRAAWILFENFEKAESCLSEINDTQIEEFTMHCSSHVCQRAVFKSVPYSSNSKDRLEKDLEMLKTLSTKLDAEATVDSADLRSYFEEVVASIVPIQTKTVDKKAEEKEGGDDEKKNRDEEVKEEGETLVKEELEQVRKLKKHIDLYILYINHVHQYDYYGACQMDCPEEFSRRSVHVRRQKHPGFKSRESTVFFERLDQRTQLRIDQPDIGEEILKLGGEDVEKYIENEIHKNIKKEGTSKYRCRECLKLFKGDDFVVKHIRSKHPELIEKWGLNAKFMNNYARDPQRIPLVTGNSNNNFRRDHQQQQYHTHDRRHQQEHYTHRNNNYSDRRGHFGRNQRPRYDNAPAPVRDYDREKINMPVDPRQVRSYRDLDASDAGRPAQVQYDY